MIRQRAFTLIELLVAMVIFSVLAVMMYGGVQWVMLERELVLERQNELRELQRTVLYLNTDFYQLRPRDVRDELGRDIQPALLDQPGQDFIVELSRDGWRNPAGAARGNLQRVQYRLEDPEQDENAPRSRRDDDTEYQILIREYWPVMDRMLGMEGRRQEILHGVEEFTIEYLDDGGQWQEDWPPASVQTSAPVPGLPGAVRYRLNTRAFGEIERLVEIAR